MPKHPKEKPEKEAAPLPETVGVGVLARMSGLTERRIQQLADEGVIPKPETRGEYKFEESLRGLFAHLRELADGLPAKRAADLARQARADADVAERNRDMLFERAIPAPLVGLAWDVVLQGLRSEIMKAKMTKATRVALIKRLRELRPRDYFGIGKKLAKEEAVSDEE